MTFFTIVATDFDGTVPTDILQRFINSLKSQTFKDFEVFIMHDGERSLDISTVDTKDLKIEFINSLFRGNAWGHNLRSLGIQKASGKFIINTNSDNIYYPNALEDLYNFILKNASIEVFISNVKMMGLGSTEGRQIKKNGQLINFRTVYYDNPRDYSKFTILTGNPPVYGNIDMMSLVATKDLWERIHYWYDITMASDAHIYERICSENEYRFTDILIGEHY
jgi:glycosyltransferase involved in cell wall biosynthesis